jgi:hypothetical protein
VRIPVIDDELLVSDSVGRMMANAKTSVGADVLTAPALPFHLTVFLPPHRIREACNPGLGG